MRQAHWRAARARSAFVAVPLAAALALAGCDGGGAAGTGSAREVACDEDLARKEVDRYEANTATCIDLMLAAGVPDGLADCLNRAYALSAGRCLPPRVDRAFARYHKTRETALRDLLAGRITRDDFEDITARPPADYL